MATNLSIDPDLIEQARKVSGERTKAAAVTKALQEFIARRRQRAMLDLAGKLEWDAGFDYKKSDRGVELVCRYECLVAHVASGSACRCATSACSYACARGWTTHRHDRPCVSGAASGVLRSEGPRSNRGPLCGVSVAGAGSRGSHCGSRSPRRLS